MVGGIAWPGDLDRGSGRSGNRLPISDRLESKIPGTVVGQGENPQNERMTYLAIELSLYFFIWDENLRLI